MKTSFIDGFVNAQSRDLSAPVCIFEGNVVSRVTFLHMVCHYAKRLHELGVQPGDVVALSLPDTPAHLAVMVAVARLGGVSLPVHTRTPPAAKQALARRFDAKWVIVPTGPKNNATAEESKPDTISSDDAPAASRKLPYQVLSLQDLSPQGNQQITAESLDLKAVCEYWPTPETPARIGLTSGTTGAPSAVLYDQAYWANRIATTIEFCDDKSRVMCGSLALTMGNISAFAAIFAGGVAVFQGKHDAQSFINLVNAHGVTHAMMAPGAIKRYASKLPVGNAIPSVQYLRIVGGGLSAPLVELATQRLTPNVYLPYGISEVGAISMASPEELKANPDCAGHLKSGVKAEVVDENGKRLKAGETGEIRVKLPMMLAGYLKDDEKTAQRFKDGWFYTNDIGSISKAGLVQIEGRKDGRINLGGNKFYPERVERVLDAADDVGEVAVFPVQVKGEPKLVAAVVWKDQPQVKALEAYMQEKKLGRLTPHIVATVAELPRNSAGKVLRSKLPELLKRKPEADASAS